MTILHDIVRGQRRAALLCAAAWLLTACGTWVGNPKGDDDDEEDDHPPQIAGPGGNGAQGLRLEPGGVLLQKLRLEAGQALTVDYALSGAALGLQAGDGAPAAAPMEVSLVGEGGLEALYTRSGASGVSLAHTPDAAGDYTVLVRNNTASELSVDAATTTGAASVEGAVTASTRTDAPFKNVLLKAVVAFSSVCKQTSADGNSIVSHTAPAGRYYVQPIVFLGEVGAGGAVTPLAGAAVAVVSGETRIALKRLAELDVAAYEMLPSSLSPAEHAAYTATFYRGYFGGAGELYTVDTFRFGGDCAAARTVELGTEVGLADVRLTVDDASIGLAGSWPVRPTISTGFSTYEPTGQRISDWTQCTYDRLTGEPKTYNGDASTCRQLSLASPPYVKLDYQLPSAGGVAKANDPTRILSYGHSFPKAWYRALIDGADALASGAATGVTLPGCLNNGGLVAVPLSEGKAAYPLGELNAAAGDVINLGRKSGSYTSLTDFYQGDVDASGTLSIPTCIPKDGQECAAFKTLTVTLASCRIKADSGISTPSVGDAFIYPEYFEMSGVVGP